MDILDDPEVSATHIAFGIFIAAVVLVLFVNSFALLTEKYRDSRAHWRRLTRYIAIANTLSLGYFVVDVVWL